MATAALQHSKPKSVLFFMKPAAPIKSASFAKFFDKSAGLQTAVALRHETGRGRRRQESRGKI
jgi:hypothetical protein